VVIKGSLLFLSVKCHIPRELSISLASDVNVCIDLPW